MGTGDGRQRGAAERGTDGCVHGEHSQERGRLARVTPAIFQGNTQLEAPYKIDTFPVSREKLEIMSYKW